MKIRYLSTALLLGLFVLAGCNAKMSTKKDKVVQDKVVQDKVVQDKVVQDKVIQDKVIQDKAVQVDFNNTIDINSSGTGLTEDEAVKSALRNAVGQAVGTLVDSETKIKNDDLISDRILTYSDGYVSEYKKLETTNKDGLVSVNIMAKVKKKNLVEKLKASNVAIKEVSGESLFAEAITKIDEKKSAIDIIKAEFKDIPKSFIEANAVSKPRFDQATGIFLIDIEISINRKAYLAFVKRLTEKLSLVSDKIIKDLKPEMNKDFYAVNDTMRAAHNQGLIFLCSEYSEDWKSSKWFIALLSNDIIEAIRDGIKSTILNVDFKDSNDKIIYNSKIMISPNDASMREYNKSNINRILDCAIMYRKIWSPILIICPLLDIKVMSSETNNRAFIISWSSSSDNEVFRNRIRESMKPIYTLPFKIDIEEAKKISKLECNIEDVSDIKSMVWSKLQSLHVKYVPIATEK